MRVVRGGDDDAVDLIGHLVEHLAEVLIQLRRGRLSLTGFDVVLSTLFGGFIQALGIDIDESNDVVVKRHALGVGLAFAVGTDDGEIEALASGVLTAKKEVRTRECSGSETSGAAEEMTARNDVKTHEVCRVGGFGFWRSGETHGLSRNFAVMLGAGSKCGNGSFVLVKPAVMRLVITTGTSIFME
jgi:hypothetical protein